MPIQNGKYVSPLWKNNAPPSECIGIKCNVANAEELANAIRSGVNSTL